MCTTLSSARRMAPQLRELKACQVSKAEYFTRLVNGNFTHLPEDGNREASLDACVSTICALCKEFELDFAADKLYAASRQEQCAALRELGEALDLPLQYLSRFLEELEREEKTDPHAHTLQHLIYQYFKDRTDSDTQELLLVMYLALALGAHDQYVVKNASAKPVPWTVMPNKKGTHVRLVHQVKSVRFAGNSAYIHKAANFIPYVLKRLPGDGAAQIKAISNFAHSFKTTLENRKQNEYGKVDSDLEGSPSSSEDRGCRSDVPAGTSKRGRERDRLGRGAGQLSD